MLAFFAMARATWVFVATSAIAGAAALWLYVDNRDLRARLATRHDTPAIAQSSDKPAAARSADPWLEPMRTLGSAKSAGPAPALPEQTEESRLERRRRRQQEFAAMFGRADGETEE